MNSFSLAKWIVEVYHPVSRPDGQTTKLLNNETAEKISIWMTRSSRAIQPAVQVFQITELPTSQNVENANARDTLLSQVGYEVADVRLFTLAEHELPITLESRAGLCEEGMEADRRAWYLRKLPLVRRGENVAPWAVEVRRAILRADRESTARQNDKRVEDVLIRAPDRVLAGAVKNTVQLLQTCSRGRMRQVRYRVLVHLLGVLRQINARTEGPARRSFIQTLPKEWNDGLRFRAVEQPLLV